MIILSNERTSVLENHLFHVINKDIDNYEKEVNKLIKTLRDSERETDFLEPLQEDKRLEILSKLELDNKKEFFESICKDLSEDLKTKSVFIGFVELNYKIIFSDSFKEKRMPRKKTICTFTILSDGFTEFKDVTKDPQLKTILPNLEKLDISSYIGLPIKHGGYNIETICAVHNEERSFTDEEKIK